MRKKIYKIFFVMVTLLVLSAGCGTVDGNDGESIAFVDQAGREVVISGYPQRIVSLSPSNTEIAFAVGLGSSMVGVTENCNYPEDVLKISKVGGFSKPNIEAVLALEPDLVLAGNKHGEQTQKLEEMGVPVLVLVPESIEDIYEALDMVGKATGKSKEANTVITDIRDRLKAIESRVGEIPEGERLRVYYEVSSEPLMSAGAASIITEVISSAGGKNIFADVPERYPKISQEVLIERDPQVILFPGSHGAMDFDLNEIASRPMWDSLTAVKENRMFEVSADIITRPGPRIVEAVEDLTAIFYPQKFRKTGE